VRRAAAVYPPGYDGLPGGAQGLRALRIDYDQDYDFDQDFVGFGEARDKALVSAMPGMSRKPVPIDWTEGRFDGSEVFPFVIPAWNNLEFLKRCHFKGVGRSRVYHFVSKSLARIEPYPGRKQLLAKWRLGSYSLVMEK
jgi:hypothetical protein